jgi:hypothetical protein
MVLRDPQELLALLALQEYKEKMVLWDLPVL